jgi:membrane fusion protein, heavy metal efflux system
MTANRVLILTLALASASIVVPVGPLAEIKEDAHQHENEVADGTKHGHDEEHAIQLDPEQIKQTDIELQTAGPGALATVLNLSGQVAINADRLAHVVPRVAGVVREVRKTLGDSVKAGEVLAVIDSRELAEVKAAYLAATERVALAQANFEREEALWKKKISAEQDYLQAKQALAEARINKRLAEQKLHALGFPLGRLETSARHSLTRYEIVAPFAGTIIEKHITLGEALEENATIFVVADLSTVWVDLTVYPKDLPLVELGRVAVITATQSDLKAQGTIHYIRPLVSGETRTSRAQVVLDNPDGRWRPGLFVTAEIVSGETEVALCVPRSALQNVKNRTVVFVQTEHGFEPHPVELGRSDDDHVEVVAGLDPGERFVANGAFTLKAELEKGEAEHGHDH